MTDRPAPEPRTEASRFLHRRIHEMTGSSCPTVGRCVLVVRLADIEAEAAQGAAPAEFASDIADIINDERATEIAEGAAPRAEGLPRSLRNDLMSALESISAALDKNSYGDSVEGDLLEAHATLDTLLSEGAAPRAEGLDFDALDLAIRNAYDEYGTAGVIREYNRLSRPSDEREEDV